MPRVIQTTGDRGHDEELDRLWREIDALKAKTSPTTTITTVTTVPAASPPVVVPDVPPAKWHIVGNI